MHSAWGLLVLAEVALCHPTVARKQAPWPWSLPRQESGLLT